MILDCTRVSMDQLFVRLLRIATLSMFNVNTQIIKWCMDLALINFYWLRKIETHQIEYKNK